MVGSKKCCARCIDDRELEKSIIPMLTGNSGECSYCSTPNIKLITPIDLKDYFELVVGIYNEDNSGKHLVEWLKEDWYIFQHPKMDNANSNMLLSEILDDGEIIRKNFVPSKTLDSEVLDSWEKLREELMHTNRFFLQTKLNEDRFSNLLSHLLLEVDKISNKWYRSRIQHTEKMYDINEMGPPPEGQSSPGRANPAGIPYLYLASDCDTAISEIRPHTGEIINVAEFTIDEGLKVLDLRNPRKTISPFTLSDEDEILLLRKDIKFLEHLGTELTRPILPKTAAIEYIPSQYLCEFIRKCGYDGVTYSTSVGTGFNFALFDDKRATGVEVQQYEVSRVSIEHQIIKST